MKKRGPVRKRHKHHHDWGGKKDDRMRYEKPSTMHFTAGEAYAQSDIWRSCGACGRTLMGEDSLAEHVKAAHG
jgi:hypothetical protein